MSTKVSGYKLAIQDATKLQETVKKLKAENKLLVSAIEKSQNIGLAAFHRYTENKEIDFKSICGEMLEAIASTLQKATE